MPQNRALVWFKRDLRVHDHAPLMAALQLTAQHTDALALFALNSTSAGPEIPQTTPWSKASTAGYAKNA
jgi:deoxyribodipyrimidine photolyase